MCALFGQVVKTVYHPMKTLQKFTSTRYLLQHFNLFSKYFFPDNTSVILPLVNKCRLIFQILVLGELLSGNSEKTKKNIFSLFGLQILWKGRV